MSTVKGDHECRQRVRNLSKSYDVILRASDLNRSAAPALVRVK